MKIATRAFFVCAGLAAFVAVNAETINLATGLDTGGGVWSSGDQLDANWTMSNADNYQNAPDAYTVFPINADWYGGWVANDSTSDWIAADPNVTANGNLDATRTFTLSASQLSGASFSGTAWTVDDAANLFLNGNLIATLTPGDWGGMNSVTLPTSDLVAGVNTLEIAGFDSDNYLEADRFAGTLSVSNVSTVPGPMGGAPMLLGLVGLALKRRKGF